MARHFSYEREAGRHGSRGAEERISTTGRLYISKSSALEQSALLAPMKTFVSSALASVMMVAGTHGTVPDKKSTITTMENAIWRSVQQKKVEQFKQFVSPNVRAVFAGGIMTRPDELKAIPKGVMKSVSLSDFRVTFPDARTAVVAYLAKVETISDGKSAFTTYNAGSVWQLTKGQWQAIFHGEAKQTSAK
jgi:hypothetical protein